VVAIAFASDEIVHVVSTQPPVSNPLHTSHTRAPLAVVRAFAPGSIGNIGPGLDILGCAVTGPGDRVTARRADSVGVSIDEAGHPELSRDPSRHASAIAAGEVLRRANAANVGVSLHIEKGLPLAGGQGGSAASAVAGAIATNELLGGPLDQRELLFSALVAEEQLAGRHIDNLAPALFGGIVLIRSIDPLDIVSLPVPRELRIVLVHPRMRLRTADARAVLPRSVDLHTTLAQAAAVASMVAAFCTGDLAVLRGAVSDRIAEPARAPLLPGFLEAKAAALEAGALGCSISGGGPTAFALFDRADTAHAAMQAMVRAYESCGVPAAGRVEGIDERGARIESAA
jgi:homoserine kinase